jgi:hypothetical protein
MKTRYQPCPKCCEVTCEAPTIHWKSRSASKTKSGYTELGTASTPLVIYLQYFYTYTYTVAQCSGTGCTPDELIPASVQVLSVAGTYDPITGYTTQSGSDHIIGYDCPGVVSDVTNPISGSYPGTAVPNVCGLLPVGGTCTTVSTTSRTYTTPSYSCDPPAPDSEVNGSLTLSVPYSDGQLEAEVDAAMPADFPNTTSGSYYNFTVDHLTLSKREGIYWFTFTAPISRARPNPCYHITWKERFTPTTGSPVDIPKSWTWDGEIPEGYDPADGETWPRSPDFTVPIPTTNGITTVEEIVVSCTDCE